MAGGTGGAVQISPTAWAYTTTVSTTPDPWLAWNATVTTTTTSAIWTNWISAANSAPVSGSTGRVLIFPPEALQMPRAESPEQLAARRQAEDRMRQERVRVDGERAAARDKARLLLLQNLNDRQRIDLASNGYFDLDVLSQNGERRRYRIRRGRAGNVHRLDEQGREVRRYCIHPVIACPDEDTMLTQKLWLENDEELFLRTANAS